MKLEQAVIPQFFSEFFQAHHFEWVAHQSQFRKSTPYGFQAVVFSVSPYPDGLMLETFLAVRHQQLEGLIYPFTTGLAGFRENSLSMVASSGLFMGGGSIRYHLKEQDELETTGKCLIEFFAREGFEILDNWSDLTRLEEVYNNYPEDLFFFKHVFNKSVRGLALSRLANSPRYEKLKKSYKRLLKVKRIPSHQEEAFNKLTLFLDMYSVN